MKKANKYTYLYVIQGEYGYGFEDVNEYDKATTKYSSVLSDLKEYRASGDTGVYRVIERRELNNSCQ